jgi:hypothetical protein
MLLGIDCMSGAGIGLLFYRLLLTGKKGKRFFSKKGVASDNPSLD